MTKCKCMSYFVCGMLLATEVQEEKKSFSNQKVVSSIPCRSVLEQDTEPLIAPDVQCAISVNVKMCIHPCKSLWIKASAKCKCYNTRQQYTWWLVERGFIINDLLPTSADHRTDTSETVDQVHCQETPS